VNVLRETENYVYVVCLNIHLLSHRKPMECKYYIMRSLMICTPHQKFSGDQIEKNGMDGACSTNGAEKRRIRSFGGET